MAKKAPVRELKRKVAAPDVERVVRMQHAPTPHGRHEMMKKHMGRGK